MALNNPILVLSVEMIEVTKLIFLVAILASMVAVVDTASAIPPPDNSTPQSGGDLKDTVILSMGNVDDIGLGFVWNGSESLQKVAYCEWENGNHGSTSVTLTGKHLNNGVNYLIVMLYNQRFEGLFGGKYSADFRLKKNGDVVWSKNLVVQSNVPEVPYWKVIQLTVSNGNVAISEKVPGEVLEVLKPVAAKLEKELIDAAPVKRLNTGALVGELLRDF